MLCFVLVIEINYHAFVQEHIAPYMIFTLQSHEHRIQLVLSWRDQSGILQLIWTFQGGMFNFVIEWYLLVSSHTRSQQCTLTAISKVVFKLLRRMLDFVATSRTG